MYKVARFGNDVKLFFFTILALMAWPVANVQAQDSSTGEEEELSDAEVEKLLGEIMEIQSITVTAEKRETSAQQTPIAISVMTADHLERNVVKDVRDLDFLTPSLVVSGNAAFEYPISLRGISSAVSGIGSDTPVAVYVNGINYARPASAIFEMANVERIEILRGPQGTLYGRNATGGAINIITKKPGNKLETVLDSHYGRYGESRARAAVSGPIIKDRLFGSFAGAFFKRDGWGTNVPDGREMNKVENYYFNGSLRFLPNDNLSNLFSFDVGRNDDAVAAKDIGGAVITDIGEPDDFFINEFPYQKREQWGLSNTLEYKAGNLTFKSITAYRENDHNFLYDSDAGPLPLVRLRQTPETQNQFSQEFQLMNNDAGRFKWITGLYYFKENSETDLFLDNYGLGLTIGIFPTNETTNYAAYTQINYDITDEFKLTAGLRYSDESKDFTNSPGNAVPLGNVPQPNVITAMEAGWTSLTPKLVLTWQRRDNQMFYASMTEGFKSGGFNFLSADPSFEPEKVNSYEMGSKLDLMRRTLRINTALFFNDYRDLQVRIPGAPGQIFIQNSAESEISGAELEITNRPARGWEWNATLSLLDAEYKNYIRIIRDGSGEPVLDANGNTLAEDLSGNKLNRAPEMKLSLSVQYITRPTSLGTFLMYVSYQHEDKLYYTETNEEVSSHNGWDNYNARINLSTKTGVGVSVFGRNLTDERHVTNIIPVAVWRSAFYNIGRTYGLEVSYKY